MWVHVTRLSPHLHEVKKPALPRHNGLSTCRARALQTPPITWPPVQLIVMAPNRGGYFKCPSCPESFGSQGAMNTVLAFLPLPRLVLLISPHQHFSTKHRHRFECSNCGREFATASARDAVRPFLWSPAWILTLSFLAPQHGPSSDKVPRVRQRIPNAGGDGSGSGSPFHSAITCRRPFSTTKQNIGSNAPNVAASSQHRLGWIRSLPTR